MYCANCGATLAQEVSYCNRCGKNLRERSDNKSGDGHRFCDGDDDSRNGWIRHHAFRHADTAQKGKP